MLTLEKHREVHDPIDLLDIGVFFFNSWYTLGNGHTQFGPLKRIPLPSFDSLDWPLFDMATSEEYRFCMRADFLSAMRSNIGSRAMNLQWFMPIHIMVDFFSVTIPVSQDTYFVCFQGYF